MLPKPTHAANSKRRSAAGAAAVRVAARLLSQQSNPEISILASRSQRRAAAIPPIFRLETSA